jgi:hypothetical protein
MTTADPNGALALMNQPGFDPSRTAIVNQPASISLPKTPLEGDARLLSYAPDEVQVRTNASREALLVLADNYYQGWKARVDGREAPILRTDHTFRGVVVPAGQHTVVFRYEPTKLRIGFFIYLIGMILLIGYGAYELARLRRGRIPAPEEG